MSKTEKPVLLFITTELPWPADSGGKIKTYRLVTYLSQHFRTRLLCAQGGRQTTYMKALRDATSLESVQAFDNQRKRSAINWIRALLRFPTLNAFRVYSQPMESMMRAAIAAADVVIVDHLEMLEMVDERQLKKVIYHSHNAEFRLWRDFARLTQNPIAKLILDWEASRVWNFERRMTKAVKFTFAAPNDIALLTAEHKVSDDRFRLTYHLGNDALLSLPAPIGNSDQPRIFYAGTLSWKPNEDGLIWFLRTCWPIVFEAVPEAQLVICGKGASPQLLELFKAQNVMYKGFVPDLDGEMAQSSVAIVPIRFGSGMKIKTLDALYRGLPLVSTRNGLEGIDIGLMPTNSPQEFSERVVALIRHPDQAADEARKYREAVASRYTYDHILPAMLDDITRAASAH